MEKLYIGCWWLFFMNSMMWCVLSRDWMWLWVVGVRDMLVFCGKMGECYMVVWWFGDKFLL